VRQHSDVMKSHDTDVAIPSVCPCVRLFVTSLYSVKMTASTIKQPAVHGSLGRD